VAEAEETSERVSDVMAQPVHFAQGYMVQCTLLNHPTPHQRHSQKQVGEKQKQGQKGQYPEKYCAGSQKQAEAQKLPEGECHYDYNCDTHL